MNKTVLTSIILGGLLSGGVQGAPLLYTDYLTALEAPISDALQLHALDGTDPKRVMNILLEQSERVTPETRDVFLDNVNFLLSQKSYSSYQPILRQLNIQALLLSGDAKEGVAAIAALQPQEQKAYRLLWTEGLMQLNQTSQAVETFNQLSLEAYRKNPTLALNAAQSMVVNYGVSSEALHLPDGGNQTLAQQLADFYERNGLYAKSFSERTRQLSMLLTQPEQQAYRRSLVRFAKEHDLVKDERALMEAYLKMAVSEPSHVIADEKAVNEYSRLLVHYYFDTRNDSERSKWSDEFLEAQRRFGKTNPKTQQAYLENSLYRYDAERPTFFYSDAVSLAKLTKDRSVITSVFTPSLSNATQQKLLAGYFSIPADADETTLVMASDYAALADECDTTLPMAVQALRGHRLTEAKQYSKAQACFSSVVWEQTELPDRMIAPLQEEQRQVEYVTMKQKGDEYAMVAIAKNGDADMRLDAAMFAVNAQPMSSYRLSYLAEVSGFLGLNIEQQKTLDVQINERLRQAGQMSLLVPRLKQAPEHHALELAYWFISRDQMDSALEFLLMRLTQPTPLKEADEVRVVRYLDSVYPSLSQKRQQQVRQVSNEGVQMMVQLRAYELVLASAFDVDTSDTIAAVQQALETYSQLKMKLSNTSVANASAQLWLLGQLEEQFGRFLTQQVEQAPEALKPVLREQASQREAQAQRYVSQVIKQKIEGVMDIRVLDATLLMGELK